MLDVLTRLANEQDQSWRFTKKGDKRPAYDIETAKAAAKAKRRAKTDARIETILAEASKRRSTAPGADIASRMLKAMEPGKYYGMGDLMRMIGESRQARGKVVQVMLKRGWVTATQNPAWDGLTLNPWEIMAGAEPQPKTLYRITDAGVEKKAALARL